LQEDRIGAWCPGKRDIAVVVAATAWRLAGVLVVAGRAAEVAERAMKQ
jgi:hypothetical protein